MAGGAERVGDDWCVTNGPNRSAHFSAMALSRACLAKSFLYRSGKLTGNRLCFAGDPCCAERLLWGDELLLALYAMFAMWYERNKNRALTLQVTRC